MRNVVIASVGDDAGQIGQLQGGATHLALSDGKRQQGERIPRPVVTPVVERPIGNVPRTFVQEVRAQSVAESETLDVFAPDVESFFGAAVFGIFENVAEYVAEIGIARSRDGIP